MSLPGDIKDLVNGLEQTVHQLGDEYDSLTLSDDFKPDVSLCREMKSHITETIPGVVARRCEEIQQALDDLETAYDNACSERDEFESQADAAADKGACLDQLKAALERAGLWTPGVAYHLEGPYSGDEYDNTDAIATELQKAARENLG